MEEGAKKSAGKSGGRAAGYSAAANTSKLGGKMRIKQCPGCGAHVSISTRECPHCDNQFSSKTTAVPLQTAVDESENIQAKFPFEPEREEEGSLIIQLILGRRPRIGSKKSSKPTELALMSAMDAKYDYDYLIKFKNMSYMHAQWLSAAEIESMSSKSTAHLNRYLTKIDKGDTSVQVDGDIDAR